MTRKWLEQYLTLYITNTSYIPRFLFLGGSFFFMRPYHYNVILKNNKGSSEDLFTIQEDRFENVIISRDLEAVSFVVKIIVSCFKCILCSFLVFFFSKNQNVPATSFWNCLQGCLTCRWSIMTRSGKGLLKGSFVRSLERSFQDLERSSYNHQGSYLSSLKDPLLSVKDL